MKVKNSYGLFHTVNIPTKNINKASIFFFLGGGVIKVLTIPCLFAKVRESVTVIKLKKKISWLEVFERNPHQPVSHVSCSPTSKTF